MQLWNFSSILPRSMNSQCFHKFFFIHVRKMHDRVILMWVKQVLAPLWAKQALAPYENEAKDWIVPFLLLDFINAIWSHVNWRLGAQTKHICGGCTCLCQPMNIGFNNSSKKAFFSSGKVDNKGGTHKWFKKQQGYSSVHGEWWLFQCFRANVKEYMSPWRVYLA